MIWGTVFVKTLPTFFIAALSVAQPSNKDVDVTSLNEHVNKMDAVLQEVQTHAQAQEQKYSAVLSSVLSQLTATTEELKATKNFTENLQIDFENLKQDYKTVVDELAEWKRSQNETELDYATLIDELVVLKRSQNNTQRDLVSAKGELADLQRLQNKTHLDHLTTIAELAEMKRLHNDTVLGCQKTNTEIAELKQSNNQCFLSLQREIQSKLEASQNRLFQLNTTETEVLVSLAEIVGQMNASGYFQLAASEHPWLSKEIGFEAQLSLASNVMANGTVVFDRVTYNEGNGYNKSSGYFTAPVSGTYLFWTNIAYRTDHNSILVFYIRTSTTIMNRAYGSSNEVYGTASATTLFYLVKGEAIWIRPSRKVELNGNTTSAGAVLIKQF